jgi:hypothetical protein
VNIDAAIKEIAKGLGEPRYRATHGQWVPYAWIVRGLVERGHEVAASVRQVVSKGNLEPADVAERSLRAAYYKIRNKPWPVEMAKHTTGDETPVVTHGYDGDAFDV